ncbi:MAG: HAMP domain-containing histidine kinase [Candidatus Marinimicrobia bacterium]|nr:HAMP domain-containing histidine kinase [Candidatus Neomarinimicrobiota bacterium]
MKQYRHTGNIKAGLFILGIILISSLLIYTQSLVNRLRIDNRQIVTLYAEIIANTVSEPDDSNLDFVFENIIQKVQFPLIQTSIDGAPQSWRNLPDYVISNQDRKKFLTKMDAQTSPIPLEFVDSKTRERITFGSLHYGDSDLIHQLQWLAYLEIFAVAIFIFLGFAGFSFIRNSEKRHIWVGMARETAHQLGTPVSALMGWVEWLKKHPEKTLEIIPEIELDLNRLEQISRRFSKMGSEPEMEWIDLSQNVDRVIGYLTKRLPSLGKSVRLKNEISSEIPIFANGSLLAWSIENIIRNGIDAIEGEEGFIKVTLIKENNRVHIHINDNGCGIPKKDWKNVFRPGFSSKKTGWGLGLSLTQRIIEDIHGGQLKVLDSSMGVGTTFEISFPDQK